MKIIIIGLIISSVISNVRASEVDKTDERSVDKYHKGITDFINDKTTSVDGVISGKDRVLESVENKTYAVFNIKQNINSLDETKTQIDFKLKVDLPNTKKRWKIFLDTNPTDFNSLEGKSKETFTEEKRIIKDKGDAVGGVMFNDFKRNWKKSYKLGVKLSLPLDPFIKANFYNKINIKEGLDQHFEQEFFLYNEKGLGLRTNLDYVFNTENNSIYQSNSSAQYLANENNDFEVAQQFSRWERLTQKNTLKYSVGVSATLNDHGLRNNYWVNARLRHKLYKDWLFVKLIPEVSFSKDNDYKPNYGLLLQLEMFFAKPNTLKRITREN